MRLLSPNSVTKCRVQFVMKEVVGQPSYDSYNQHQQQAKPKCSISIHFELHSVVVSLRKDMEHEFRIKDEVKHKVEENASPYEKMIDSCPILREKRDLQRNERTLRLKFILATIGTILPVNKQTISNKGKTTTK